MKSSNSPHAVDHEFWILWSPTGTTPPVARFTTEAAAKETAEAMARRITDAIFYVMKATSYACTLTHPQLFTENLAPRKKVSK